MKKLIIILSGIFVLVIVLAVIGIYSFVSKAMNVNNESKQYVDAAVPAIVSQWDINELKSRLSPEFNAATSPDDLNKLYKMFRKLGKLKAYHGSTGSVNVSSTTMNGTVISARYVANADFEAGPASITITLIKHGNIWQIAGFRVDSKVFLNLIPN